MFKNISQQRLVFLSSLAFTAFYNFSFFKNFIATYGTTPQSLGYALCSAVILCAFLTLFFTLLSSRYTSKAVLIFAFIVSAFMAYFMDNYGVVIDSEMIRNVTQTNFNESADLFSARLVIYVAVLGVLPAVLVYRAPVSYRGGRGEIVAKLKVAAICIVLIVVLMLSLSKFYASFFREHKSLRYYTNPTYWIYSTANFAAKSAKKTPSVLKRIGTDATINEAATEPKELVILVVGESARADHFALNGYARPTDPFLSAQSGVVSFTNVSSCGTSTAQSVPCMFSDLTREEFSVAKASEVQNVLDVLNTTKDVSILWRDNNSDSKGVALRTQYEDFKTSQNNKICDVECRDEGMLEGLDQFVAANAGRDILIILHQMGNHGPAYFKRYPKKFEKFTPVCESNQLEQCSTEEITNAYDNAIVYTDYFLSRVIDFLKPYAKTHETAMIYMSDHGESLGEGGVYLHGMPYMFAPQAQKHIAAMIWMDGKIAGEYDLSKLAALKDRAFSHDNLFHTLLGIFEVKTEIYRKDMDMLYDARLHQ